MQMGKNVNNEVTMNPPVLDRGYWIPFCVDPMKSYPGIVWTATAQNWSKSLTHIKHRFGALNTYPHFRLSRVPVIASTHLLLLRFEYLFTLRRRGTETYPVYDDPRQDWRGAALFRCKNRAEITFVMCDHVVFRVDARAFRYSQRT